MTPQEQFNAAIAKADQGMEHRDFFFIKPWGREVRVIPVRASRKPNSDDGYWFLPNGDGYQRESELFITRELALDAAIIRQQQALDAIWADLRKLRAELAVTSLKTFGLE